MKTIIKVRLYVEVETEDGLDRKLISASIDRNFIPEFFRTLKVIDLLGYFSSSSLKNLKKEIGDKSRFKLMSDSDLFERPSDKGKSKDPWNHLNL